MKTYLGLSLVSLLPRAASAQDTASARAETALHVLQDWYNPGSGIWDTCGWWNGANCMTVLGNLALVDGSEYVQETALEVFNNTFHVGPGSNPYAFKPPPAATQTSSPTASSGAAASPTSGYWGHNPQWVDGSFDDDGWWALAWITAYDNTQQQEYLNAAVDIYESLASTEKTRCGNAGIYTDLNAGYANAVTNELFLSVGAHLANRVPDKKRYLQQAQRQWDWFQNVGFINENGTINDGLTDFCTKNGQPVWSYNQGIVLGALVELHRASTTPCLCARGKNSTNSTNSTTTSYLESATRIAKAAIKELADPDSLVIRESCDPDDCDGNSTQFKGIFIRNLRVLHGAAPDQEFAEVIRANADSVWEHDRSEDKNQLGESWEGPVKQVDASTHSSAMGALVAAIGV